MRGLLIRSPWIEKILEGWETWGIRSTNIHIRGRFDQFQYVIRIVDTLRIQG